MDKTKKVFASWGPTRLQSWSYTGAEPHTQKAKNEPMTDQQLTCPAVTHAGKGGHERVACKNQGRQDAVRQSEQQRALTRSTAGCRPSGSSCSDTRWGRLLRWCRHTPRACGWRWSARGLWGCGNQWRECQRRGRPSWGWDLLQWGRGRGYVQRRSLKMLDWREELTHSVTTVGQVRRDSHRDLLPSAQAQQGFVHTLDHVAHPDVSVVGAVSLVADKETHELVSYFYWNES